MPELQSKTKMRAKHIDAMLKHHHILCQLVYDEIARKKKNIMQWIESPRTSDLAILTIHQIDELRDLAYRLAEIAPPISEGQK